MSKRKVSEILWLALQYAKSDRLSLINAYDNNKEEDAVIQAKKDIKAFEKLQNRVFGTTKSETEIAVEKTPSKNIFKIFEEDL
jgi:hypothetical protein